MGRQAALWLLPIEGAGPTVDGIHWPLSADAAKHEHEARDTAPPPPASAARAALVGVRVGLGWGARGVQCNSG
jgi:hypothetical protein